MGRFSAASIWKAPPPMATLITASTATRRLRERRREAATAAEAYASHVRQRDELRHHADQAADLAGQPVSGGEAAERDRVLETRWETAVERSDALRAHNAGETALMFAAVEASLGWIGESTALAAAGLCDWDAERAAILDLDALADPDLALQLDAARETAKPWTAAAFDRREVAKRERAREAAQVEATPRSELLTQLDELAGAHVRLIVRDGERETWALKVGDSNERALGNAEAALTFARFRAKLLAATGVLLPDGLRKPWPSYVAALYADAERHEPPADAWRETRPAARIGRYLAAALVTTASDTANDRNHAIAGGMPFVCAEGVLHITVTDYRKHLRIIEDERLTAAEASGDLGAMGARTAMLPYTTEHAGTRHAEYWALPAGVAS